MARSARMAVALACGASVALARPLDVPASAAALSPVSVDQALTSANSSAAAVRLDANLTATSAADERTRTLSLPADAQLDGTALPTLTDMLATHDLYRRVGADHVEKLKACGRAVKDNKSVLLALAAAASAPVGGTRKRRR